MIETNKDTSFNDLPQITEFNKVLDDNKVKLEVAKNTISQIQEDAVVLKTNLNEIKNDVEESKANIKTQTESLVQEFSGYQTTVKESFNNFNLKVFGDANGKNKDGEDAILPNIEDASSKINDYYNKLVGKDGIKTKIDECRVNIEQSKIDIQEIKDDVVNSQTEITNIKNDVSATQKTISDNTEEVTELLESTKENKETFDTFCTKIAEREALIKKQNEEISKQKQELQSLNDQSSQLLAELTDKSLHNAFKIQAVAEKKEHDKYFHYSLCSLGGGFIAFLILFLVQAFSKHEFSIYELWLIRVSLITPFGFAYYLCSTKSSISMKLANEYQHKASISEALSGYRKLWNLEHGDAEYKDLFDPIARDLIKNPFDKIKISNKDVFENVTNLAKAVMGKNEDSNKKSE